MGIDLMPFICCSNEIILHVFSCQKLELVTKYRHMIGAKDLLLIIPIFIFKDLNLKYVYIAKDIEKLDT